MKRGNSKLSRLVQAWITEEQYQAIMSLSGIGGTIAKTVRILLAEALKARGL